MTTYYLSGTYYDDVEADTKEEAIQIFLQRLAQDVVTYQPEDIFAIDVYDEEIDYEDASHA